MICSDKTWKLLILSKLKGVGPKALCELADIPNFDNFDINDISYNHKKLDALIGKNSSLLIEAEEKAQQDVDQADQTGSRIISIMDEEFPSLLRVCDDKPAILYVKGNWHQKPDQSVAIIGTREPTEHGKIITERISEYFIESDWSIVSGLAIGCDTIAHRTSVNNNGHTVAVLSHGLQTIAPKQNKELAHEILDKGGILITEYKYGVEARPHQFVQRDRIQAALSKGVVMIQSDIKGGSMHASRATLKYGRILAVPHPTNIDINMLEPKIQANLLLSGNNFEEKMQLLGCTIRDLENIFIVRNKEDYSHLLDRLSKNFTDNAVIKNGQQTFNL